MTIASVIMVTFLLHRMWILSVLLVYIMKSHCLAAGESSAARVA